MDAKPYFLHKHYLLYDEYEKQEAFCDECNRQIDGRAFTCEHCKFWLHKSCAKQKLPLEISHPDLHSKLSLHKFYFYTNFFCDKCFSISRGYGYTDEYYSFKLDVICAFSTNDQTFKEESEISKDIGKTNQHFCHRHPLTLFNYRKVRKYEYCCSWCEKPLSGMSYGCFDCSPSFFLHHFCLYTIPNKILQHPFHPSHPLYIKFNDDATCNACEKKIVEYCYSCTKCKFHLHPLCAKLKPTLRHECHEHYLTYIATKYVTTSRTESFQCLQKCNSWGYMEKRALYRCVQCNRNFHFECLIPSTINHKYHRHSLTIMTSFREDDSGEYYCDICEKQRNPNHHVYCCTKCQYIAHIECALGKVVEEELYDGSTSISKYEETQRKDPDFPIDQIEYFSHEHPLILKEVIEKYEKLLCEVCELEVCDQAYGCETCKYYLHKTCAELSLEVLHPLHSLDHPLILFVSSEEFICDKCLDVSCGYMYRCLPCNFKLDIKCVVGTASNIVNQGQGPKEIERPSTATIAKLFHFIHNHELRLGNCRPNYKRSYCCRVCHLNISGPAYCCLNCRFYLHKSCLGKLPGKIQIPSHPHTLLPFGMSWYIVGKVCLACKQGLGPFCYRCSQCNIYIHFSCAGSLLKRPLSSKSHSHNLYLFPRDIPNYRLSECGKCNKPLKEESIYRCIECDTNFHLQCVGISYRVKSKRHIHPLTLKDCFVEDDLGEYYCDICEEERDPKADVYYCQECDGFFVAHIECVVAEVEEVLQQYGPAPYSPP